jgi:hypothetical protein
MSSSQVQSLFGEKAAWPSASARRQLTLMRLSRLMTPGTGSS